MQHVTTNEWKEKLETTEVVLTLDDGAFNIPRLVICDSIDPNSKFYFSSPDLNKMAEIANAILKVVKAANGFTQNNR